DSLQQGRERERDSEEERERDDGEWPAPRKHRNHDRHEALALSEERLELSGDDGEIGAADPGERARRERGVAPRGEDADPGRVERVRLLAGGPKVQADVGRA